MILDLASLLILYRAAAPLLHVYCVPILFDPGGDPVIEYVPKKTDSEQQQTDGSFLLFILDATQHHTRSLFFKYSPTSTQRRWVW